jgi:hypothetical protein
MSNEHPILFTAPMVRAILEGRKTQTRRVIDFARIARCAGARKGRLFYSATFDSWAVEGGDVDFCLVDCPYGKPGDVLWVQEGFRVDELSSTGEWAGVVYRAGGETMKRIPADKCDMPSAQPRDSFLSGRFMPRWASRLLLEVTDVRVERVEDISEEDAQAEGCPGVAFGPGPNGSEGILPSDQFRTLWDSINAHRGYSWESNPYVWVVTFKRKAGE